MEWKGMERCHFSGSKESLGHLVERKIFSNQLDINADFSTLSQGNKRHLMGMGQIKLKLFLGMNGRQFRLAVRAQFELQLLSRAVYVNGQDRSQRSVGGNVAFAMCFKFESRGSVSLYRR